MPLSDQPTGSRGVVVDYVRDRHDYASEHERVTRSKFARRLARLKGFEPGGVYDPAARYAGHVYFVPSGTLVGAEAAALGITGRDDLFGGVVPHAFMATKAISHPLVAADAAAPPGWNPEFEWQAGDAVLAGYTVFSPADARRAGLRLLASGPARIKPVRATGGRGQVVVRDAAELQRGIDAIDPAEIAAHGLVLEEHLSDVTTFSVGQVMVGELTASYFGFQKLTRNNQGEEVYGGSDLTVARGDFDALLAQDAAPEIRHAVEQARRYDAAANACFAGFFASRNNYDIVRGRNAAGRWRSGVLEQSWRVGGATGAELAALEVFRDRPECSRVRAAGTEVFGDSPDPPPGAVVYFRGIDPEVGALTKYTVVEHVDAR